MQRYFIQISYDGTNYHGWQVQENTVNTVQQSLSEMLSTLLNQKIMATGCGRTDTGVHATEFFAHFDVEQMDLMEEHEKWIYKFNKALPPDIAVHKLLPVKEDASARFDAISRTYEYRIHQHKNPFLHNKSAFLIGSFDLDKMNAAAKELFQYSDFSSFSKSNTQTFTNNCSIFKAAWSTENNSLIFTIAADRFLRNMVRAIVGTLLDVGRGKVSIQEFKNIIESKTRSRAGLSVLACGLYLTQVAYPKNYFDG